MEASAEDPGEASWEVPGRSYPNTQCNLVYELPWTLAGAEQGWRKSWRWRSIAGEKAKNNRGLKINRG